jgi:predicted phosphoribosyltransferase
MDSDDTREFRDREDAGRRLGDALRSRPLRDPLVLAIPRGGVAVGAPLARSLGAELDVVLARKLRAPFQPEYAIGAIAEDGHITLNPLYRRVAGFSTDYLDQETRYQMAEIDHRKQLFRAVRSPAAMTGRSVIVTDDGIATGSTVIAALQAARSHNPHELIVAVPVAAVDRLEEVRRHCDDAICLLLPDDFYAVGQFYRHFEAVEDEEVVRLLREANAK